MKYDFDKLTDRTSSHSLKWDCAPHELPMWVADMDFETAPCIARAVSARAAQGIFGYTVAGEEWYSSVIDWWKARHGWQIRREWLILCTGIVPAVTSMVKRLSNIGDEVVVQTPVYDIFFHSIENTGRRVLESPLVRSGDNYEIDFSDLEQKLSRPDATLMILCNPHNPAGRIWSAEELKRVGDLCIKHGVTVISDEIHCDITAPGCAYTPFASLGREYADICAVCLSATKAFNIAGLQCAAVAVPNKFIRAAVERGLNSDELAEPNCFAAVATAAAFNGGAEWLDEARKYLFKNRAEAEDFIAKNIPSLRPVKSNATYLMWMDCSAVTRDSRRLVEHIRSATGLWITAGDQYRGDGAAYVRINLACPAARLADGLQRLKAGVESFKN